MAHTLGLILANRAVVLGAIKARDLLEQASPAEPPGVFDAVWVGASLLAKPRLESVALLSALAAVTRRVRLGVGCLATFVHRHPVLFAQQWASLDVLSEGRAWLAVCLGGPDSANAAQAAEHAVMGIASAERVGRLEDGIVILRKLFSETKASHGSPLYHNINVNEDRQAGLEETKKFLDTYYSTNFTPKFVEQWTITGDPKSCAGQLRAYADAGLGHMALRLSSWDQRGQLARFLNEVVPSCGGR